ncbi:MAG: hypothetical protein IPM95_06875 [Sphingobacteriales bacterium]|nr:hypothetical protein [Sphingobacteriales bacterium]
MKQILKALLSLFFLIAIAVHIYYLYLETDKQYLWHTLYFVTYGACWRMLFSKTKNSILLYFFMMLFPFITHFYFGYRHLIKSEINGMFWVCLIVCILLPVGLWVVKQDTNLQNGGV